MSKKLEIELIKSPIGNKKSIRVSVRSLGLKKLRQKVLQPDTPATRGQINKVSHLVTVRTKETADG